MKIKKILFFCLALSGALVFSGCISNDIRLSEGQPFAVLSVRGNMNVPWLEERDDDYKDLDGMLTNAINKTFGKNNPEILTGQDRINYAADQFAYLLETNAGVEVISKEKVVGSSQYKAIVPSIFSFGDTLIYADDYKKIDELASKKTKFLLSEINGKSTVFLTFTFNKVLVEGSKLKGQVAANVTMNIDIYDQRGRQQVMDSFTAQSDTLLEIDKTNYDKDALVDCFPEIIDLVINQFIVKYM